MGRPIKEDLSNRVFNRLTVIAHTKNGWLCRCQCGGEIIAPRTKLVTGKYKSCGCWKREVACTIRRTHGKAADKHSRVYRIWNAMKQRCHNPNQPHYHRYGGRGIRVCDEWRRSFQVFYEHMGDPPTDTHSLDRIDNYRGYEPGNVRWATRKEQRANRRGAG